MNDGGEKPSIRLREKEQITMNIVCLDMEGVLVPEIRSEEHTSELQSLRRISYAVFCLK